MLLTYEFDVVGGGFDGAPALAWLDDGQHPPPELIFVGVCGPGRNCGTSKCRPAAKHVSYWVPGEDRPSGVEAYTKQEEHVERDVEGELHGRATYAIGGLLEPRNFGTAARVPVPDETVRSRPLVPAGRYETGWS